MIIWLNGPFGIGKTTTAHVLVERLPNALLYDPEIIGSALSAIAEVIQPVDDYQDLKPWRALVVQTARLLQASYGRTLVVPMIVWRRDYFDEIATGFRDADTDLRIFRLSASVDVLSERIRTAADADSTRAWRTRHLAKGLALMVDSSFGDEIDTANRSPDEVAETIIARLEAPPVERATYARPERR